MKMGDDSSSAIESVVVVVVVVDSGALASQSISCPSQSTRLAWCSGADAGDGRLAPRCQTKMRHTRS
jgi:hypothetical protein